MGEPASARGRHRLRRWGPLHWSDPALLALVALSGALAALGVQAFEWLTERMFHGGFTGLPAVAGRLGWPPWVPYLLVPAAVGLLVGACGRLVPPADRLHSVPLVILGLLKREGRIAPGSTLLKTLGAALTLGAGGSLGREGPVVLLGGGIGSALGQVLRLPPEWLRTVVAAGAAAAIATAFHAPITGAFFVLEIVLIQFTARSFALVALGSVTAAAVARLVEGHPPFPIPAYRLAGPWEVAAYVGLGAVIAPVAHLYMWVLHVAEHRGARLGHLPAWARPVLGGLLFGAAGYLLPQTLGGGYAVILDALRGQLTVPVLLLLLAAKCLTLGITIGSGWTGGVFAPAMYLGAMAGGVYGAAVHWLLPGVTGPAGAYAVVGMAAMIAGATQAPLTALALVFEVTRDYQIALPAMLACGMASVLSQRISPYSVDTVHLPEHGVVLPWQVADLRAVPVADAMVRQVQTVRSDMTLGDVVRVMQQQRHGGYPVLDPDGRLVGIITLGDIRDMPLEGRLLVRVADAMHTDLATVTPDQTLADAALAMARRQVGRLPVVDPQDPGRLLGILTRSDILRAYPRDPGGNAPR